MNKEFKNGDGFPSGAIQSIEERKEIYNLLYNAGYTMLCEWFDIYSYNGVLFAMCKDEQIKNPLTLADVKEILSSPVETLNQVLKETPTVLKRYKLCTGLWTVKEFPEFATDQEAWEALRHILPNKYATLYREEKVPILINNSREYLESHNSKYTLQIIPLDEAPTRSCWIPIMIGITSDEWKIDEQPPFK